MNTAMIWQTYSTSSAETERLGELLGSQLKGGEVIELRSDLGGGKTTFVKGLARGASSKGNVTSPTFTLSRIYKAKQFQIHHFDFYRLNNAGILTDQLAESIQDKTTVVVIEWADIVANVLPKDRLSILFEPVAASSEHRKITFEYPESKYGLITGLETSWRDSRP